MIQTSKIRYGWLTLALLFPLAAQAELYKWVDKDGNVTYSQVPPPNQSNVKTIRTQSGPRPSSAAPKIATEPVKQEKSAAKAAADPASQDIDAIRKQNCEASRKNLEIFTTFNRVQDEKGEVTVLDDTTRAAKIKDAEVEVKRYCTSEQ